MNFSIWTVDEYNDRLHIFKESRAHLAALGSRYCFWHMGMSVSIAWFVVQTGDMKVLGRHLYRISLDSIPASHPGAAWFSAPRAYQKTSFSVMRIPCQLFISNVAAPLGKIAKGLSPPVSMYQRNLSCAAITVHSKRTASNSSCSAWGGPSGMVGWAARCSPMSWIGGGDGMSKSIMSLFSAHFSVDSWWQVLDLLSFCQLMNIAQNGIRHFWQGTLVSWLAAPIVFMRIYLSNFVLPIYLTKNWISNSLSSRSWAAMMVHSNRARSIFLWSGSARWYLWDRSLRQQTFPQTLNLRWRPSLNVSKASTYICA